MPKYRKKPIVIDAIQSITDGLKEKWISDAIKDGIVTIRSYGITIKTLEGTMVADETDYIIRGVNGEIYPCKADIFQKTYEEVNDDAVH